MNNSLQVGCLFSKLPRLFVNFLSAIVSIFYRVCNESNFQFSSCYRSMESKKGGPTISPLCSPSSKVGLSSTSSPKTTMSGQPSKLGELSPIPSRATHSSPHETVTSDGHPKHLKQSLSQTTIPEEGPEHLDKHEPQLESSTLHKPEITTSTTPEETGAKRKTTVPKDEPTGSQLQVEPVKTRQESLFFKAIRGSNRSESKSKPKDMESPSQIGDVPQASGVANTPKSMKKDKKNVQEKRDLFKKSH